MSDPLAVEVALLIAALIGSAFFSSAETSLTSLSDAKVRHIVEEKRRGARYLGLWLERPNRVLTTILIGNNIVNTLTASLVTVLTRQLLGESLLSVAVAIATIALLVFGEITPKTFAKHNAERLAPIAMAVVRVCYVAFYPAVLLFTWMSKVIVQLSGGQLTRTGPFVTAEEVEFLVHLGDREGVFEKQESELLKSVFEFGETTVREVMVPRTELSALHINATFDEVVREAREGGHTRFPVYDENIDDVKGIFHAKEIINVFPDGGDDFVLADHLRPTFYVPELMLISELLKEFQRRKTHMALVVDEYGGTSGIVCLEDVLEEIVGEIRDEYDEDDDDEIRFVDNDHLTVEGRANLSDLGEAIGVTFPDDEGYETVAGFLIARWGKMPPRAARITYEGWQFIIKDADDRKVERVELERLGSTLEPSPALSPREHSGAHLPPRPPPSERQGAASRADAPRADDDSDDAAVVQLDTFREKS